MSVLPVRRTMNRRQSDDELAERQRREAERDESLAREMDVAVAWNESEFKRRAADAWRWYRRSWRA